MVNPFCIAPTLLDEVELAMEFWEKNDQDTQCFVGEFRDGGDVGEIRLIIANAVTTAACSPR